jgi:prepilin-type N-terminal cleavage/methylation domain-containing protein
MKHRAFSLIEVLVVVAIIAIVAAILFPVFRNTKKQSYTPSDISNMRQVYLGIVMYEDSHGDSPGSLVDTAPWVRDHRVFKSLMDDVPKLKEDYPADLYVAESLRRSAFRISYAYLRSFEETSTWPPRFEWSILRADPAVALLANRFYCPKADVPFPPDEHDFFRAPGTLYRIRTDGSLWKAHPQDGITIGGSINGLFIDP